MSGWSKSKREISEKVDKEKDYPIEEAINLLKELSRGSLKSHLISLSIWEWIRRNLIKLCEERLTCLMVMEKRLE